MKTLVTGGAGFIGSHLVDRLISEGHDVTVIDDLSTGRKENLSQKATFHQLSITDPAIEPLFFGIDIVFHLAAQVVVTASMENPIKDAWINILGSLRVLEACRKHNVRKIIYSNSGGAGSGEPRYLPVDEDHPISPLCHYGVSKHSVEHYLSLYSALYGLRFSSLRYANVYGPRQDPFGEGGVVAIFSDALLKGKRPTIFGDGTQTRDFIYVEDAAEANMLLIDKGDDEIYNVSTGTELTINDLFKTLKKLTGSPLEADHAPQRKGEIIRSFLSNDKIKGTGWHPRTGLEEGLKKTIASLKNA